MPMGKLEEIPAHTVAPGWKAPPVTIDVDMASALLRHQKVGDATDGPVMIYRDGSEINGKVGAAAVVPSPQQMR
jgi:hypothetical protein